MKPRLRPWQLGLLGFSLLHLAGCSDHGGDLTDPGTGGNDAPVSFDLQIQPIFDQNCIGCHGMGGNAGLDLRTGVSYGNLVGVAAQASVGVRVVGSNPTDSVLYQRLTGAGVGIMPPAGSLGPAATELVRRWIDEGAADN